MRFDGIQILRAIAANAVVLRHVQAIEQKFTQGQGFLPEWFEWLGVLGVDLFFVISGFVIIRAAARENWREFIFARITRISDNSSSPIAANAGPSRPFANEPLPGLVHP